jgi:DnaK suppressor protein
VEKKTTLTPEQLEEIRNLLLERKRLIEETLRKGFSSFLEESPEESTDVDVNEGDESLVDVGREMDLHVMSQRTRELKQINEALRRMEMGLYGICEECDRTIRFERLRAMPFTTLCLSCQQELESQQREMSTETRGPFRIRE